MSSFLFFFQEEDGRRDFGLSRGLGDVYKRQGSACVGAYVGAGEPVIDDIARIVRDKAEADVRRTGPSLGGFAAATGAQVGPSAVGKAWGLDSCSSDWCRMTELAACSEPCSSRADMI